MAAASYTAVDVILDSYLDVDDSGKQAYAEVSSFTVNPPGIANVKGFSFMYARVPFTYYVVNEFNNQFTVTEFATTYLCQLVPASYNSQNLATAWQSALKLSGCPNWANYSLFVSELDLRFNLWNPANAFSLQFLDKEQQLGNMMGFYPQLAIGSDITSTLGTLYLSNGALLENVHYVRSTEVVNLLGDNLLRLSITGLNPSGVGSVTSSKSNHLNLALFPVNASFGSMIEYRPEPTFVSTDTTRPVQKLGIGLYFADNRTSAFQDIRGRVHNSNIISLRGSSFQVGIRLYIGNDA